MGDNKDFEYVWNVLQKSDKLFGNFIMQSTPLMWYQKVYRPIWFVVFVTQIMLDIWVVISDQSNLDLLFVSINSACQFTFGIFELFQMLYYKRECMEVLFWCQKIQKMPNWEMKRDCAAIAKIVKILVRFCSSAIVMGSVGLITAYFLNEEKEDWRFTLINALSHEMSTNYGLIFAIFYYSMFGLIYTLFQTYLQILQKELQDLKTDMQNFPKKVEHLFEQNFRKLLNMYCEVIE